MIDEKLKQRLCKVQPWSKDGKIYPSDPIKIQYSSYIADMLLSLYSKIETHWDIGCGTGWLVKTFEDKGIISGGVEANILAKKEMITNRIIFANLEDEFISDIVPAADLISSIEVAEHISKKSSDHFVNELYKITKKVLFFTASPEEGEDHLNPQPKKYWIDKFSNLGMIYSEYQSQRLMNDFNLDIKKEHGLNWFRNNVMVFYKSKEIIKDQKC